MAPRLPALHRGEIDGVPAYWVKRPGPLRAALIFRVGQADEPLPVRGISHLVEHLSLHELHGRSYPYNGLVNDDRTIGHASGEPEQVVEFLATFTSALSDLPVDRLATEQRVLRTEASQRSSGIYELMLVNRYGARGYGATAYAEYGLRWLGADRVRDWAATRFTRGNAALFLSGPPPAGLALHLPDGPRLPPPPVECVPDLPGWFPDSVGGVAVSFMTARSFPAMTATALLARRLQKRLRHDEGVVYGVETNYGRRGPKLGEAVHWLRALDECHEQVVAGVSEVLADLASTGFTEEEAAWAREQAEQRLRDPDWALGIADSACYDELNGAPVVDVRASVAEQRAVTADLASEALRDMLPSALVAVPHGQKLDTPFIPVPPGSPQSLSGKEYAPVPASEPSRLVVAREGITVRHEQGAVTVRFDRCEAALWWTDGSRRLIGDDGFAVTLTPESWNRYGEVVGAVDSAVARDLWVPMGDRTDLPPPAPAPVPLSVRDLPGMWRRTPLLRGALIVLSAVFGLAFWGDWAQLRDGIVPEEPLTTDQGTALAGAIVLSTLAMIGLLGEVLLRVRVRRRRVATGSG